MPLLVGCGPLGLVAQFPAPLKGAFPARTATPTPRPAPGRSGRGGAGGWGGWATVRSTRPFGHGLGELGGVEPGVGAVGGQQLVVGALLDDVAGLHHQDQVGVADRRQPVRDDEARPAGAQRGHRPLDQHLGAGVDRAGRLVEDQDRRVGQERPRDGDQLLLARR